MFLWHSNMQIRADIAEKNILAYLGQYSTWLQKEGA